MKYIRHLSLVIATVFTIAAGEGMAESETIADGTQGRLVLNHGQKWGTNKLLRSGMNSIRGLLKAKLPGIQSGTLTPDEHQARGASIVTDVTTIVAHCELPPSADANLHVILAELLTVDEALQGKGKLAPAIAARQAVQIVNRYAEYFADRAWIPIG